VDGFAGWRAVLTGRALPLTYACFESFLGFGARFGGN